MFEAETRRYGRDRPGPAPDREGAADLLPGRAERVRADRSAALGPEDAPGPWPHVRRPPGRRAGGAPEQPLAPHRPSRVAGPRPAQPRTGRPPGGRVADHHA